MSIGTDSSDREYEYCWDKSVWYFHIHKERKAQNRSYNHFYALDDI